MHRKVGRGEVKIVTIEAFAGLISALSLQLIVVDVHFQALGNI